MEARTDFENWNSFSPEEKKAFTKAEIERKRQEITQRYEKIEREMLSKGGFEYDKLTEYQRVMILQPSEAPENYMCDGEISGDYAFRRWKKALKQSGLSTDQIEKAVELNFGL
jgi:SOS response regulatory protein OraA/RecX